MMGFGNGIGFSSIGMLFWMFLQWGLLIAGIYLLIRWVSGRDKGKETALKILSERYARGEINEEEYLQRKGKLRG